MTLVKYDLSSHKPVTFTNFIDRFFNDEFFGGKQHHSSSFSPQVDIAESEKEFEIRFYIPGMKKDDIKISVDNDRLTVSGERKLENDKKDKNYHSVASYYGSFSRSFYLPDHIDTEKINASYSEGILSVVIPKDTKKETKKTIAIK